MSLHEFLGLVFVLSISGTMLFFLCLLGHLFGNGGRVDGETRKLTAFVLIACAVALISYLLISYD
jgi:hypothetical protein